MLKTIFKVGIVGLLGLATYHYAKKVAPIVEEKVDTFTYNSDKCPCIVKKHAGDVAKVATYVVMGATAIYAGIHILDLNSITTDHGRRYTTTETMSINQAAKNRARTTFAQAKGLKTTPPKGTVKNSMEHELYLRNQMKPIIHARNLKWAKRTLAGTTTTAVLGQQIWNQLSVKTRDDIKWEIEKMGLLCKIAWRDKNISVFWKGGTVWDVSSLS